MHRALHILCIPLLKAIIKTYGEKHALNLFNGTETS